MTMIRLAITILCTYTCFCVSLTLPAQWTKLPGNGAALRIAVDPSYNRAWVIGVNKSIYYFEGAAWREYPGGGKALDITVSRGTPAIIGLDNKVYQGSGSGWTPVISPFSSKSISSDPASGQISVVETSGKIYYQQGNSWAEYPGGGRAKDIAVNRSVPYVVGLDNNIWYLNGSRWQKYSGSQNASTISINSSNGYPVIVKNDSKIFFFNGTTWIEFASGGKAIDAAGQGGTAYAIGIVDKAIYAIYSNGFGTNTDVQGSGAGNSGAGNSNPATALSWSMLPGGGKAKRIVFDASTNRPWVIGLDNSIYYFDQNKWTPYPGGGKGLELCVYNNTPYVIGLDKRIYRGNGRSWDPLHRDLLAKDLIVDSTTGRIWFVGMKDNIYYIN